MVNAVIKSTLAVDSASKTFSGGGFEKTILKEVSYSFVSGVSYVLCGKSGAGKSTLMNIIAGLDADLYDHVRFNGVYLGELSDYDRSFMYHKHVGIVFQEPLLVDEFSVIDNIVLKGMIDGAVSYEWGNELVKWIGLADYKDASIRSLSIGQRHRVAVARALYTKPDFLIADEPTAGLDSATALDIMTMIRSCTVQWGMGVIISSHDTSLADAADTVLYLEDGVLKELRSC